MGRTACCSRWYVDSAAPVTVSEQVLVLVGLSPGVKNPYTDQREAFAFNKAYLTWNGVAQRSLSGCAGFRIRSAALLRDGALLNLFGELSSQPSVCLCELA